MERYASGEVPQVGDTVVCVDDCGSGHPPTVAVGREYRVDGVSVSGRYVTVEGGNFNVIYAKQFRLVRRWVDVSVIDGGGVFHVAEPKPLEGASLADALKEARGLFESCRAEIRCLYQQLTGNRADVATGSVRKVLDRIEAFFAKLDAIGGA